MWSWPLCDSSVTRFHALALKVFPLKNGVSMRIPQSETDYHHTYHDTCAIFCWIYDGHFYEAILKYFEAS